VDRDWTALDRPNGPLFPREVHRWSTFSADPKRGKQTNEYKGKSLIWSTRSTKSSPPHMDEMKKGETDGCL
jgi:hypothetical protein